MRVRIGRWGNGLGLRLPRDIVRRAKLREGAQVDVAFHNGRLVIAPRYTLKDLLTGMTPGTMRDAFAWGPDRGREAVGE
jgi:antitoxin MazE